ncbi:hypothetical protein O3P69_006338 [Scylla paramamosain]|uniref:Carbonic anhydrase n=1 Tax=Scylla paramamosain TaxID=85552 RepID=A0AAW0U2T6_SCYPA
MVMVEQEKPPVLRGGDLEGPYNFLQYHFHWGKDSSEGSEHTIDGRVFPAELHLVHYKASYGSVTEAVNHEDGIAVLGIMLELTNQDNPFLNPIFDNLEKIVKADTEVHISPFALDRLLPKNVHDFFRYEGSLTTPTCNEIVIWTVFKDTIKISHKQLAKFRILMDEEGNRLIENFRPVQPLNGREVYMGRLTPYWSYVPPFDPPNWPKSFPICGSDVRQSPVALVAADAVGEFPRLTLGFKNYGVPPASMILFNNGHTAQANPIFAPGKEATIQGGDLDGKYQILQFHFHWGATDALGSEHTIEGKRFPLEIHIVHWKTSYGSVTEALNFGDGIAVLGIMAEVTKEDNPKLQPIIEALAKIHEPDEETELHSFVFSSLLPKDTDNFFRYEGSLTTPTCNEIVIWTVFRNSIPYIFQTEFRKLRDDGGMILQNNFRQPLPLNGREVFIASRTTHWSYIGDTAPKHWPVIFPQCGGKKQSPVALVTNTAVTVAMKPFVLTNYDKAPAKMTALNNGHTAQFMVESDHLPAVNGGGLDGGYTFLQFHFHWGANDTLGFEHTIDDKRFPAELHVVHFKTIYGSVSEAVNFEDGITVLGAMLEVSDTDNPKLQPTIDALSKIREAETEVEITPFALGNILPSNLKDFFRYNGSLTTPTCNEIVIWTVFKQPIPISRKQLAEFRKLEDDSGLPLVDNFRPLQNLNGRKLGRDGKESLPPPVAALASPRPCTT